MDKNRIKHVITLCLKKDRAAQKELYEYLYKKLMNVPLRYVQSAEDAKWHFNLGMLRIFESLARFKTDAEFLPWARTILIRSTIDELRRNNKFKTNIRVVEPNLLEEIGGFDLNHALADLEYKDIMKLLQLLNDKQRVVFSLHEIDDYTHEEIFQLTGININTSKWLLAKAKKRLKQYLENKKTDRCGYI